MVWAAVILCACGARTGTEDGTSEGPGTDAGPPLGTDAGPPADAGPPPPPEPLTLAAGAFHSCTIRSSDGDRVWCWGCVRERPGSRCWSTPGEMRWQPRPVEGSEGTLQLAADGYRLCILDGDRRVRCLGPVSADMPEAPRELLPVEGLGEVEQVASDGDFACAVTTSGRVACWGDNTHGQLGDPGVGAASEEPVWIEDIDDAVFVDAGQYHSCAVRRGGTVVCWGENAKGQLGDGTRETRLRPVQVRGVDAAVRVSAGHWHSCALTRGRRVVCWGSGWLGDGADHDEATPDPIAVSTDVVQVAVGGLHTCVRVTGGDVYCWGNNDVGQAGGEDLTEEVRSPTLIEGLAPTRDLAAGWRHTCVDEGDDRILCWGEKRDGRLGADVPFSGPDLVVVEL